LGGKQQTPERAVRFAHVLPGCEFAWLVALTEFIHALLSMQDGVLELRGGKCILYNDAGKKVTESKTKVSALREDDTLQVGGWDLEVYTPIAETDYFSGKAFMVSLALSL